MAKKKVKSNQDLSSLVSNSSPLLEINFPEPLFALCCHPEKPLIFSGQATGLIMCHSYDPVVLASIMKRNAALLAEEQNNKKEKSETRKKLWTAVDAKEDGSSDNKGFKLQWKTKRHKGSVRAMCLDADGSHIYSIGIDCMLKKANSETGRVVKKHQVSSDTSVKYTKIVKSTSHNLLLLGDENGNVVALDSHTLEVKTTISNIHSGDAINDIFQFTGKSMYKFISLGQTTLAYWDSRESNESDHLIQLDDLDAKRKVRLSDDQEDEILCGTFVDPQNGDTLVCGMGEGILTVWKPKKNDLVDQISRIKVKKNESLDCIVPTLQDDDSVWVGCSDGQIYKVNVKTSKVVEIRKHNDIDEVLFVDLDHEYRLVSGGMDKVKIWEFTENGDDLEKADSSAEEGGMASQSDSGSDFGSDAESADNDSNSDTGSGSSSDSEHSPSGGEELVGLSKEELLKELDKDLVQSEAEEEASSKKRGAGESGTAKSSKRHKVKQKPLTSKQLQNLQKQEHGIKKFDDL
ncbi:LADA_0H10748g1_1 [Lachancea dasiensis]|uniref:WD repeat-containing protein JIP5 n=1 Tax=Lachancea dasiensis TaxID=1072105 RepID=A0A1G4K3H7_9SACH|nr:LADA_0H10748g1_1 [Lachancea dasiensis]